MKLIKAFMVLLAVALLVFAVAVSARSYAGIVVNNADSVTDTGISSAPSALNTLLNQVTARVVFEFADSSRGQELPSPPGALDTRLSQVRPRIVFEFADSNRGQKLLSLPGSLNGLLSQVTPRVIFEFANSSRGHELAYPLELIGDTTAPQISGISARPISNNSANILWNTDEFADSVVRYGTQPGNYIQTETDPLYAKDHVVNLNGLTPGDTYYFQVSGKDQSGNSAMSGEHSFVMKISVYLPVVIKR